MLTGDIIRFGFLGEGEKIDICIYAKEQDGNMSWTIGNMDGSDKEKWEFPFNESEVEVIWAYLFGSPLSLIPKAFLSIGAERYTLLVRREYAEVSLGWTGNIPLAWSHIEPLVNWFKDVGNLCKTKKATYLFPSVTNYLP